MNRWSYPASLCLAAAMLVPAVHAQTTPSKVTPLEQPDQSAFIVDSLLKEGKIMRASDARRGMKGYALSVFQGAQIERFPIEVLGVLQKVMGGGDLVLIKVTGGPVVARQTGIIQGMSGSPVYIDGKMLGAIAIGFGFPKEPIGGVTPITQMIQAALPDNGPAVTNRSASAAKPGALAARAASSHPAELAYVPRGPLVVAGQQVSRVVVSTDARRLALSGGEMTMRPCTSLVQLSGVSASSLPRWKKLFEPYGFTPVMGGGPMGNAQFSQVFGMPSQKRGVVAPFVPGAAIGVQLASGDLDMTGIGTVTFRWGKRVLAFGHPMFGLGNVSMPMTTAYVHDLFPAYDISFKLASPIAAIGALQQDTPYAIGGTIGKVAETIPITIAVQNGERHINKTFRVHAIKDPSFTPQLVLQVAGEALTNTLGEDSNKMLRIRMDMQLEGGLSISRTNSVYAAGGLLRDAAGDLLDSLVLTQMNGFERGALKSVSYQVTVEQERKTARIRRISADRNRVKAGETVKVSVVLEPQGKTVGEPIVRQFSIAVPADAPEGALRIVAAGADNYWMARARAGGAPPRPTNLAALVAAYSHVGSAGELLLTSSTSRKYLMVDRVKVPNPPASWGRMVSGGASGTIASYNEVDEQRESTPYALSGMDALVIPVESERDTDRKRPDSPTTESGSAATVTNTSADAEAVSAGTIASSDDGAEIDNDGVNVLQYGLLGRTHDASREDNELPTIRERADQLRGLVRALRRERDLAVAPPSAAPTPAPPPPASPGPASASPTVSSTPTPSTVATPPATGAAGPIVTPSPTPGPTPDPAAGSIARPAGHWTQRSAADFERGTFQGTEVRDDGLVLPGRRSTLLTSTIEPTAWSLAVAKDGTTYVGTGHAARLLKIKNGTVTTLYEGGLDSPEVAISALVLDAAGNLYAGVSPAGKVLRFAGGQGRPQVLLQTTNAFIHDLKLDAAGRLWVATGGSRGAIYRVEKPAESAGVTDLAPFAVVPQPHVTALSINAGVVYAGTGDDALVMSFDAATGAASTLYQAPRSPQNRGGGSPQGEMSGAQVSVVGMGMAPPGTAGMLLTAADGRPNGEAFGSALPVANQVTGLVARPDGLYFSLLGSGGVWRWRSDGGAEELYRTPGRSIYALESEGDTLLAGVEGGDLWQVLPTKQASNVRAFRLLDAKQPQLSAIAVADGHLVAATSNNAAVYGFEESDAARVFTSNVFDAGQFVKWGGVSAVTGNAEGSFVVETRSGNTLEPDTSWSSWQNAGVSNAPNAMLTGHIASPGARYLQYRVRFNAGGDRTSLSRIDIIFRAPNHAPEVGWTLPTGTESFSGKKTVTWVGLDPDKDPLRFTVSIAAREEKTWTPVELKSPTAASTELDTSKYKDGVYRLKVVASDASRNPEDPAQDQDISEPFTVDNTPPSLTAPVVTAQNGGWQIKLTAADATSTIAGAEWRLLPVAPAAAGKENPAAKATAKPGDAKTSDAKAANAKPEVKVETKAEVKSDAKAEAKPEVKADAKPDWQACAAEDGIFDSSSESIVARIEPDLFVSLSGKLASGSRIELRIRDAAGNAATSTVVIP